MSRNFSNTLAPTPVVEEEKMEIKLIHNNYKELTTPCDTYFFEQDNGHAETLAKDMIKLMYSSRGLGLAANQCGYTDRSIHLSIFVMRGHPEDFAFFNPRIVSASDKIIELDEGCLSFPNLLVKIKRPESVRLRFEDIDGETMTKEFNGLAARVIQHELYHIQGKMWFQDISRLRLEQAIKKAKKLGTNYEGRGLLKYLVK